MFRRSGREERVQERGSHRPLGRLKANGGATLLVAKIRAPLPVVAWPAELTDTPERGVPPIIESVEGTLLEGQVAACLNEGGARRQLWVRPGPLEAEGTALDRLVAEAMAAVPQDDAEGADVTLVVKSSRSSLRARERRPWARSEIALVERPESTVAPGRRALWRRERAPRASRSGPASLPGQLRLLGDPAVAEQLAAVVGDRPALMAGLLRAGARGMRPPLPELVDGSRSRHELIAAGVARLLGELGQSHRDALLLAARLGYVHHSLLALLPCYEDADHQPWWEPLEGEWLRMTQPWRRALCAWPAEPDRTFAMRGTRLVGELEQVGALPEAVDVALRAGLPALAAQVLEDWLAGSSPIDPAELDRWLWELPPAQIRRSPLLTRQLSLSRPDTAPESARGALTRARDALSDCRSGAAQRYVRAARSRARRERDEAAAIEGRQLAWVVRRAAESFPPARRVTAMLWAAGLPDELRAGAEPVQPETAGRKSEVTGAIGRDGARVSPSSQGLQSLHRLEAGLLGPLTIALDGKPVEQWSGMLGRSLLAHLVWSHPQPVTRDALLSAFWRDVPVASARNRLHVALHELRKDLTTCAGVPVVVHLGGSYGLSPDVDVVTDLDRVEALTLAASACASTGPDAAIAYLEEAVALYRGSFCQDCPHDEWAQLEREYQHGKRLDTMTWLARLFLERGDAAACVEVCRRLLIEDRCHEDAHRLLMRAHSRLGQHHLALRQFERCRRDLRAELNLAPDTSTVALAEAIRRRHPV